ncbi:MAG: YceK/YidQ family lipoprotein [bacterium]
MSMNSRALRGQWSIPRYYPGVCTDAAFIASPFLHQEDLSFGEGIGNFFIGVIDFPLSAIYDTILLPMDIWAYDEGSHPRETQIKQEFKDGRLRKQEDKSNQPSDRTR